jgi:hypothetical protein
MQWSVVVALALCLATSAEAQEANVAEEAMVMPAALAGVDVPLAKRMQRDMGDVAEDALTLILGYGRDGGITRDGIAESVAVERAVARAQVMRRMIEADLNADGTVSAPEIAVIVGAAPADLRGRIMRNHGLADRDGDGAVSATEAQARAEAYAMERVSDGDAARVMALIGLDLDGNGVLTLAEVDEVARLMAAAG